MSGIVAIVAAFLAFVVPLAITLLVQQWRTFFMVLAAAVAFFGWLTLDLQRGEPSGLAALLGPLLGGLMLFGFAAGAIAKFVMLVGRRPASEIDSSRD